jgi:hypothetical protein
MFVNDCLEQSIRKATDYVDRKVCVCPWGISLFQSFQIQRQSFQIRYCLSMERVQARALTVIESSYR